jgi:hypothetical protein
MKNYCVKIEYVGIEDVYVEANNIEEAKEQALKDSNMRCEGAEVSIYEVEVLKE